MCMLIIGEELVEFLAGNSLLFNLNSFLDICHNFFIHCSFGNATYLVFILQQVVGIIVYILLWKSSKSILHKLHTGTLLSLFPDIVFFNLNVVGLDNSILDKLPFQVFEETWHFSIDLFVAQTLITSIGCLQPTLQEFFRKSNFMLSNKLFAGIYRKFILRLDCKSLFKVNIYSLLHLLL